MANRDHCHHDFHHQRTIHNVISQQKVPRRERAKFLFEHFIILSEMAAATLVFSFRCLSQRIRFHSPRKSFNFFVLAHNRKYSFILFCSNGGRCVNYANEKQIGT